MTVRGGGDPMDSMAYHAVTVNGSAASELRTDAHDCIMVRLWKLGAFWRPFSFRARYDRGATQSCLEQIMSKGTVKWFNPTKGYGFIQPQGGGGRDVFVHISAVERAGLSSLNEGQVVEYEEVSNRGKTSAENLKVQR
jgi:cold shock protein